MTHENIKPDATSLSPTNQQLPQYFDPPEDIVDKIPETLAELAEEYTASSMDVRTPHTMKLYVYTVRRFNEWLGREGTLRDLNEKTMKAFIVSRQALDLKPATVEREGNKLLCLWRWAAARSWVQQPRMRITKCSPKTPTAWSRQELRRLWKATEKYEATLWNIPAKIFFTALLRIFWDTGERIGAVSQLRWADVDLAGRWVTFRAETRKGRGKSADNVQKLSRVTVWALKRLKRTYAETTNIERVRGTIRVCVWEPRLPGRSENIRLHYTDPLTRKSVRVSAGTKDRQMAEQLARELEIRLRASVGQPECTFDEFVFINSQRKHESRPTQWYFHLKKILKAADLPYDSRSMFHRMRRTHATHLYVMGGDPTASLGHYNDQMTRDYYLDPRYTRQAYAADVLNGGVGQVVSRMFRRVKVALGLW